MYRYFGGGKEKKGKRKKEERKKEKTFSRDVID